jgi:TRAP-type transport system small permease protein
MAQDQLNAAGVPQNVATALRLGETFFKLIIAVTLAIIMCLTFMDVIGRYFLNAPVPGAFDITELTMGIMVFSGLPLLCAYDQHVSVDLIGKTLSDAVTRLRVVLIHVFSAIVMGTIAWQLLVQAARYRDANDVSMIMNIPLAPFAVIMLGLSSVSTLVLLVRAGLLATNRIPASPPAAIS